MPEEMKRSKNERRKDKENMAMETSEDEAMDVQGRFFPQFSIICHLGLFKASTSRNCADNFKNNETLMMMTFNYKNKLSESE